MNIGKIAMISLLLFVQSASGGSLADRIADIAARSRSDQSGINTCNMKVTFYFDSFIKGFCCFESFKS